MAKSLLLFLSGFCFAFYCLGQPSKIDCSSKQVQDSLITHYIDNGAATFSYNNPKWHVYLDSLIAICPTIARAYQQKALPYIKSGDFGRAFPLEDKAVEYDPVRWIGYRAFLKCIFSKDYEGAIADFDLAQKIVPNSFVMDHSYCFYKGLCFLELKNFKKAERNLLEDIQIQTKGDTAKNVHYNTLLYCGIVYYEMKQYKKAEAYLKKCLSQFSQLPDAHFYLAMVYKVEGKVYKPHLEFAKKAFEDGYKQNEDNEAYAYYPHQITLYEVLEELKNN
ncbi:tetratricopeptide repeat protein [Runella sp.]|uniref:tetratricopeptide repeat protein n=1 Tax=Runella sp. TaxID=1960881 RepID=UPI003D0FCEBE